MTATNMCSNFGGKWSSLPLKSSHNMYVHNSLVQVTLEFHLSKEAAYILRFLQGGQMVTSGPSSPAAYIFPPSCASLSSSLPLRFLLHAFFKSLAEELSLHTLLLNRSKS